MELLERYNKGLITRGEYIEMSNLVDTNATVEKKRLKDYAYNYYFGRVARYARTIEVENQYVIESIIYRAYDCANFTKGERGYHQGFAEAFNDLILEIDEVEAPIPIGGSK